MEPRFGHDFSGVRVHADGRAAESARSVSALAYTVGQDVVFGAGQYKPAGPATRGLLAHELAHVVQQRGGTRTDALGDAGPADVGERAADRAAASVLAGETPSIARSSPVVIQRKPVPGSPPDASTAGDALLDDASPFLASAVGSANLDSFVTGSAELRPQHVSRIRSTAHNILVLMRRFSASSLSLQGHTDTVGTEAHNLTLGQARADSVRAEFASQGIPGFMMTAESAGETGQQAVATADNVPNAKNRRVEVIFEPKAPRTASVVDDHHRPPDIRYHPKDDGSGEGASPGGSDLGQLPAPSTSYDEAWGGLIQNSRIEENSHRHLGLDLSSGVTANAPLGVDPGTYTVGVVWRNFNLKAGVDDAAVALDVFHEPTLSVQVVPMNPQVYQLAVAVMNLHLRRHRQELIELSLSPTAQVNSAGVPGAGVQGQIELHLTTRFSLAASSSIGVGPHNPLAPPDRGTIPLGTEHGRDWTWSPVSVSALVHFW
jgi:outer membrane protein OmpA-like peptidoglycan-associated protein